MDRLLSGLEICHLLADDEAYDIDGNIEIAYFAKAQDLKTAAAVVKWLDEPCKEHYGITHVRHNHIDCPQCMAELRGDK